MQSLEPRRMHMGQPSDLQLTGSRRGPERLWSGSTAPSKDVTGSATRLPIASDTGGHRCRNHARSAGQRRVAHPLSIISAPLSSGLVLPLPLRPVSKTRDTLHGWRRHSCLRLQRRERRVHRRPLCSLGDRSRLGRSQLRRSVRHPERRSRAVLEDATGASWAPRPSVRGDADRRSRGAAEAAAAWPAQAAPRSSPACAR